MALNHKGSSFTSQLELDWLKWGKQPASAEDALKQLKDELTAARSYDPAQWMDWGSNPPKTKDEAIDKLCDRVRKLTNACEKLLTKMDADATAQNAAVTGSQLDTDYATTFEGEL
jgi:hypothetical protein